MICNRCEANNPDEARFCQVCGAPLTGKKADDDGLTATSDWFFTDESCGDKTSEAIKKGKGIKFAGASAKKPEIDAGAAAGRPDTAGTGYTSAKTSKGIKLTGTTGEQHNTSYPEKESVSNHINSGRAAFNGSSNSRPQAAKEQAAYCQICGSYLENGVCPNCSAKKTNRGNQYNHNEKTSKQQPDFWKFAAIGIAVILAAVLIINGISGKTEKKTSDSTTETTTALTPAPTATVTTTPTPTPTPAPTPTPTTTVTASSNTSTTDFMSRFSSQVRIPQAKSVLSASKKMYVMTYYGTLGYILDAPGENGSKLCDVYEGEVVTVYAQESGYALAYVESNGTGGWINLDILSEKYYSGPNPSDTTGLPKGVERPKRDDYIDSYEIKYVKTKHGSRSQLLKKPDQDEDLDENTFSYVYESEKVTVLARRDQYSFIRTESGERGWTYSSVLTNVY